jgi:hypothetical protein
VPSLSSLVDNFNDGIIGPDWGNSYGGASESGGLAHVPCTTGFAGYQTAASWTFAGATLFVKVVSIPAASTATDAYCGVLVNSATAGTRIGFTIKAVGGLLRMQSDTGYFDAGAVEIAYSPTTHAFLRLREDGTNVYWDTSPDGTTWTNRRTLASPAWIATDIDQCALDMSAHRDAGTADEATYDLFNTLANGAVVTGSADLTADSSVTAAASATVQAGADLSTDGGLVAAPILVAHAAADLAAQSDLAADAFSEGIPEVASLAAGDLDLYIEQGSTFVQTYTVSEPADFTWNGWQTRAQIRTAASANGELLLDLAPYLTVIGAAVRLAIPASVTATLDRNGVWDLEMYQGSTVVRILNGKVTVSLEVTR